MKTIFLVAILLTSVSAQARTCKAVLNGKLKQAEVPITDPYVFYPNDAYHSAPAKWGGPLTTKAYVNPPAVELTCGKPFEEVTFEPFEATGLLPETIITYPWTTIGWDGKPKIVPPETLYGFGDSGDYPTPPVNFKSYTPITFMLTKEGLTDICNATSVAIPGPLSVKTEIVPEPYGIYYQATVAEGMYRWDRSKSPAGQEAWLELENPEVAIVCDDNSWTYELEMDWPYIVEANDPSLCGPGKINRHMKVTGTFKTKPDTNEVQGLIEVEMPTVTSSGSISGSYAGSRYSYPTEGFLYTDGSGKQWIDIDTLAGGHGITWYYKLMCPYGTQTYSAFAAVYNYLWIYNVEETMSETNVGYFKFDPDGDEREIVVDKGGQGIVTFRRKFKRN